jgi:hypothetical protein
MYDRQNPLLILDNFEEIFNQIEVPDKFLIPRVLILLPS